jgi:outer membrane protein assembly factor BamE (lipoprotein component of BamABCDE complex)
MKPRTPLLKLAGAAAMALGLAACASRLDTHGNPLDPDAVAEVKPGKVTRDEVSEILGAPSTIGLFDGETWYYISERTETTAFFAPEVKERQVFVVHFDDRGMVSRVETIGLDQGRDIEPVDKVTPTAGNDLTLFEQLLGNLGRFNKENQ